MILTGNEIKKQVVNNAIVISPFDTKQLTTNSYDLLLGNRLLIYTDDIINPKKELNHEIIEINESGFLLEKGAFVLGHSVEKIGSNHFVGIIHAKSSIARLGLFVHVTADLIDIGSVGQITFQLYATLPIKLYPNMLIAQVSFWKTFGDITLYSGKYQGSEGPKVSEIYKNFIDE